MPLTLSSRTLLDNGDSIVDPDEAARILLRDGRMPPYVKVSPGFDGDMYEYVYRDAVVADMDETCNVEPEYRYGAEDHDALIDKLYQNNRDGTDVAAHNQRLDDELAFFVGSGYMDLLCALDGLIARFKEDGVVWGVGRGSSCASYTLFVLEVHDVNPVRYDIPFREFSKQ